MMNYGGNTPKRHVAYSNNPCIGLLGAGKLRRQQMGKSDTTKKYVDITGKVCYTGSRTLKKTGTPGCSLRPIRIVLLTVPLYLKLT